MSKKVNIFIYYAHANNQLVRVVGDELTKDKNLVIVDHNENDFGYMLNHRWAIYDKIVGRPICFGRTKKECLANFNPHIQEIYDAMKNNDQYVRMKNKIVRDLEKLIESQKESSNVKD